MENQQFEELLQSVRDMGSHMGGKVVAGAKVCEFPEPDVKAIRERTGLSLVGWVACNPTPCGK